MFGRCFAALRDVQEAQADRLGAGRVLSSESRVQRPGSPLRRCTVCTTIGMLLDDLTRLLRDTTRVQNCWCACCVAPWPSVTDLLIAGGPAALRLLLGHLELGLYAGRHGRAASRTWRRVCSSPCLEVFRKEPFFHGQDNYDQLVKIARVLGLSPMLPKHSELTPDATLT